MLLRLQPIGRSLKCEHWNSNVTGLEVKKGIGTSANRKLIHDLVIQCVALLSNYDLSNSTLPRLGVTVNRVVENGAIQNADSTFLLEFYAHYRPYYAPFGHNAQNGRHTDRQSDRNRPPMLWHRRFKVSVLVIGCFTALQQQRSLAPRLGVVSLKSYPGHTRTSS